MSTAMSTTLIDLNSDTVTKATDEMRKAMAEAVVGDDVDGNDPTTNEFEKCAAVVFGKEAALFVPSGTMGNLIALLVYCEERGSEVIVGDEAHIHYYEQGGMAQIGGIYHRTVKNKPNGTFDITELENKIRVIDDDHLSITKVICLENTHNRCGGVVLPMDYLKQVKEIAEKHGLFVHMDGARLANAAVKLKAPCHEITKYCDSVSVCMSKGLCSPVGSVLCGSKSFIKRARRYRKVLGGGMRQSGHLTAACLISLHRMMDRLKDDHLKARNFAMKINEIKSDLIKIDMESVQTNIVLVTFEKEKLKPEDVVTALSKVKEIAEKHGLFVHMDGARLANAAVKLEGLCSPVGSVLCGSKSFIKRARRYRKVLGGGMRQTGHLTAACLISLHRMMDRLKDDHLKAWNFAMKINEIKSDLIKIDMESVQTNIVLVTFENKKLKPEDVVTALSKNVVSENGCIYSISAVTYGKMCVRFTFHLNVKEEYVNIVADRLKQIVESHS
ncbi:putative low-specificity L-threonine aldolase 2 [Nymphon striatum]|nr:putative low-specificity L-threonine aldolase 2 [Nymphon striatum]